MNSTQDSKDSAERQAETVINARFEYLSSISYQQAYGSLVKAIRIIQRIYCLSWVKELEEAIQALEAIINDMPHPVYPYDDDTEATA